MIPGWASNEGCWGTISGSLRERGHEVVHHPWKAPIVDDAAPSLLVGWSLGALRALEFAGSTRQALGLVLLSGTARFTGEGNHPGISERVLDRMRRKLPIQRDAVLEDFSRNCFHPAGDDPARVAWLEETADESMDSLEAGLEALATLDLRGVPEQLECPALVIHGSEDRIIPPGAGRALAGCLSGARYHELAGVGHALPLVAGGAVRDLMEGFLDAHFSV